MTTSARVCLDGSTTSPSAGAVADRFVLPAFADRDVRDQWENLVTALVETGDVDPPAVTSCGPVAGWLGGVQAGISGDALAARWFRNPAIVLRHGVAFTDLARFGALLGWRPNSTSSMLQEAVEAIAEDDPGCPVRDALGWALLAASDAIVRRRMAGVPLEVGSLTYRWRQVGLGRSGWFYAAAGLTPGEARAGLDAGGLDEQVMAAMAALRGVPLPV